MKAPQQRIQFCRSFSSYTTKLTWQVVDSLEGKNLSSWLSMKKQKNIYPRTYQAGKDQMELFFSGNHLSLLLLSVLLPTPLPLLTQQSLWPTAACTHTAQHKVWSFSPAHTSFGPSAQAFQGLHTRNGRERGCRITNQWMTFHFCTRVPKVWTSEREERNDPWPRNQW